MSLLKMLQLLRKSAVNVTCYVVFCNSVYTDQAAPHGACRPGNTLFGIKVSKIKQHMTKQMDCSESDKIINNKFKKKYLKFT